MIRRGRTQCFLIMIFGLLGGCANSGSRPVEFLDEHTAASVTVVARPIAFAHPRASISANVTDFVSVTAVAVNRDGKIDYLLVSRIWSTAGPNRADQAGGVSLILSADDRRINLGDAELTLRDFGVSVPVQTAAGVASVSAVTRMDPATLRFIATAHSLTVQSAVGAPYALFDDGRTALAHFVQQEAGDR